MPLSSASRLMFLGLAALQLMGLQVEALRVPWVGSVALAVLLFGVLLAPPSVPSFADPAAAGSVRRWPGVAGRLGLAALTVAALLLDARYDGLGWPLAFGAPAEPGGWGPVEALLVTVAGGSFAAAAFGVLGFPRRWRWRLPVAAAGAATAALGVTMAVLADRSSWPGPAWGPLVAAATPLIGAATLLTLAAGVAVAARRRAAGAGLAVLAGFILMILGGVLGDSRLNPPATYTVTFGATTVSGAVFVPLGAGDTTAFVTSGTLVGDPQHLLSVAGRPSAPEAVPVRPGAIPGDYWSAPIDWRWPVWVFGGCLLALVAAVSVLLPGEPHGPTLSR